MTTNTPAPTSRHLEPCPFCGRALHARWSRQNPKARCRTETCKGAQLPALNLDMPDDIVAWNTRAPQASEVMRDIVIPVSDSWQEEPTPAMLDALRTGSQKDWPSDELCRVRYAALRSAALASVPGVVKCAAAPCQTCNDHGAVGNILTAEPCPECTPPAGAQNDAKGDAKDDIDVLNWLQIEISAIDCRHQGDPSYDHDAYWMRDRVLRLIEDALASAPVAKEPLFWFRPRSDGGYEGPIHNDSIEHVRKLSGAWVPLYAAPQARYRLAAEHVGMRVDYTGLFGWACDALKRGETAPAAAETLRQLYIHLTELGQRWYSGDSAVVDELLQLYCIESDTRAALAAQPGSQKKGKSDE